VTTVLVTGAAGFIGAWTAQALAHRGDKVIGVDNFNSYYDPGLKRARVAALLNGTPMHEADIADEGAMAQLFKENRIDKVCHLAAQAGVRYSLEQPFVYEKANNLGTLTLLEMCRHHGIKTFVYASSSSVYGGNKKIPFAESDPVDHPVSLYAATKKYNELIAHTYGHLYGLHCTGLRFFTVYGPWGRPDMAYFKFTKEILSGHPIDVYNGGKMKRDFTYITDVVAGVLAALDKDFSDEVFNIGNSNTVDLERFIQVLETELGKKAQRNNLPMQPGDVLETYADISKSRAKLGFNPATPVEKGLREFVSWFKNYSNGR
jgi:UDP-glucuronate 4-epimerase